MKGCSIHNHQILPLAVGVICYIRPIYVFKPFEKYFLVMVGRRVKMHLNPRVIIRLLFGQNGPLAMEDNDGLKGGVTVGHNMKNNSGLLLVPATAVRFAGHGSHPLPVIVVAAEEFEGYESLI
jgi:hypothetical protein